MAKKLYYKIGEACKKLDIQPYVLRYWETEFPPLSPDKSKSGQRVYSQQDLAVIRRIKELLYEEGYTIAGAKKKLEGELSSLSEEDEKASEKDEKQPEEAKKGSKGESPAGGQRAVSPDAQALRKGIQKALEEARSILELLDSRLPPN